MIELDHENVTQLEAEVQSLGNLPERIDVLVTAGDCFTLLTEIVNRLESDGQQIAPAFVFIDPYGFTIPGQLLNRLLRFQRVELFINVIWRELDMGISQARSDPSGGMAKRLDSIFYGKGWLDINADNLDDRALQCTEIMTQEYCAKWGTSIRMLGENKKTRYVLLHLTNHPAGRDLMKDCIWKICPDGGFYASKSDNPYQELLIQPEPDLAPLKNWVMTQLQQGPKRWSELEHLLHDELWRQPQLNFIVRKLKKVNRIKATHYTGKFSKRADPLLTVF